ncbi:alpha/beta hydrolase [Chroococcidiopsis sp. CCALA 051]|uniref:alpha/beta fold hydrolase n=1 Tax=Chroococcidiopsis sp. CCALA 051 TaxID=869949 RepID=UPI000D0DA9AE|nr:alpha/beta hydrolase [Chroococcidiopsis sp. CCALA 051]MBE9016407.1 alpha/beta hydrolase [Chroococcidiopsidales cyanobacterium LEGE 13417]PSM49985.1 alpha/beta hydrolase [Chroococcidiopsis sp. CCALA 051]
MTVTQSTDLASTQPASVMGGEVREFPWSWQGQSLKLVYETLGQGTPVLLLPAFSTVSTRGEMAQLAKLLSPHFQAVALDWIGFGVSSRLPLDYRPELYQQLLKDFVNSTFQTPIIVIAAGHAAGYAMQLAATQPQAFSKIVLVAPTWRGPLTVMGVNKQVAGTVRQAVRSPVLGQALYKMNTTPGFLRYMYGSHVYADKTKLTDEFIQQKWEITQQPGARFAPAAFVTGNLDPVQQRQDFLNWFQSLSIPVLVVIGEQSPPKSRAEMEALATLPGVQTKTLPGSLGLYEEYAAELAEIVLPFLL